MLEDGAGMQGYISSEVFYFIYKQQLADIQISVRLVDGVGGLRPRGLDWTLLW